MSNTVQATNERPPFWRDERILAIITQVLVVTIVIGALLYFYSNMVSALKEQMGVAIDFGFLKQTAGFDIGESLIEYSRQETYARAFMVGLLNTLQIAFLGIIFTTILGIIIGVMRLSSNWLISRIAMVYIELFRNIPLLVLLIFWAQAVFFKLPRIKEALILFDPYFPVYLSNRGIATPWGIPSETWATFLLFLVGGLILAIIVAVLLVRHGRKTGRMPFVSLWFVVTWLAVAIFGWFFLSMTNQQPLSMTKPALEGLNTKGGRVFSQQFMALLSGLVLLAALVPALGSEPVAALSRDLRAALRQYPHIEDTQLDSCSLCHISDTNFRLDPYGDDYDAAGGHFEAIESIDSDGDGFNNVVEIYALTFPGDPTSVPTGSPPPPGGTATETPAETATAVPPSATATATSTATTTVSTPAVSETPATPETATPTPEASTPLYVPWAARQ